MSIWEGGKWVTKIMTEKPDLSGWILKKTILHLLCSRRLQQKSHRRIQPDRGSGYLQSQPRTFPARMEQKNWQQTRLSGCTGKGRRSGLQKRFEKCCAQSFSEILVTPAKKQKRPRPERRWSCVFFQTAGKSLSVLTTAHPKKPGATPHRSNFSIQAFETTVNDILHSGHGLLKVRKP